MHIKRRVPFIEEMRSATFCYSPMGYDGGQTDRYIAAMLLGCIPVILRSAPAISEKGTTFPISNVTLPLEEHPAVDWDTFSVPIRIEDVPRLPEILAAADVRRLRRGMGAVWRRFLWTGIYSSLPERRGAYLNETAGLDAFESMMDILAARLAREEQRPQHGPPPGEGWENQQ